MYDVYSRRSTAGGDHLRDPSDTVARRAAGGHGARNGEGGGRASSKADLAAVQKTDGGPLTDGGGNRTCGCAPVFSGIHRTGDGHPLLEVGGRSEALEFYARAICLW